MRTDTNFPDDLPVVTLAELAALLEPDVPTTALCVVCFGPAPEDSDYCSRYCWEQDNFDAERRCDR